MNSYHRVRKPVAPPSKVHKTGKDYTRSPKHHRFFLEDEDWGEDE